MRVLFLLFLAIAAWQDFKSRRIPVWLYLSFAILGTAVLLYGGKRGWAEIAVCELPGAALLLLSRISGGGIGAGDGWFFAVAALYLRFWEITALLFYGLLFCSAWGLGIVVWGCWSGTDVRKRHLPFLPFMVPAWLWMILI